MQKEGKAAFAKEFGKTKKRNQQMLAARAARENAQQGVKTHDRLYNEGKFKLRRKHNRN